jgi:hypothetical protein
MASMMYILYAMLVIVSLTADFLNLFLAPAAALFASESGWLPRWLWWFQTPDNSLDGDEGWKAEHRPFMIEDSKVKRWWNRTRWMHRNSMYGFAIGVLGYTVQEGDIYSAEGSESVGNRPLHNGLVKRKFVTKDGEEYWQCYYVKAWSKTKCIRINLGWKLWGNPQPGKQCAFVFSVNPFMGYSQK